MEEVVKLELGRMASYLKHDEEALAALLAEKTDQGMLAEKKALETTMQETTARNNKVAELYEHAYEDNADGKITDEWFMHLSHKYEEERMELKERIADCREKLDALDREKHRKEAFLAAIRKFMEMGTLTAPLLHELIDHIDVYETEGTGKNRAQRIVIYYRFVGYIELPDSVFQRSDRYRADTRQGVAVEYIPRLA